MRSGVIFPILMLLVLAVAVYGQDNAIVTAQQSHVDAHVPDKNDFDAILRRDITSYVTDKDDKGIGVTVELLRDRPTQAGVGLPKFYVWIEKRDAKGAIMEQAAARIAAIDKIRFDVIQYFKRERITAEPDLMKKVFPEDVYEKILAKVRNKQ